MTNFSIKDLLIHILHGGVILCAIIIAFDVAPLVEAFDQRAPKLGTTALNAAIIFIICYLLGLFLDAIADFADTKLFKRTKLFPFLSYYPSYYLLKDGECCDLKLAHHIKIRERLCRDAMKNDAALKEKKCCKEGQEQECKEGVWECEKCIMLLYNYAKNRAFAHGSAYQIARIESFFGMFVFFRNMMTTTLICLIIFAISCLKGNICSCTLMGMIFLSIPLMIFFYLASYKYRTYYCRTVLGSTYSPKEEEEEEKEEKRKQQLQSPSPCVPV